MKRTRLSVLVVLAACNDAAPPKVEPPVVKIAGAADLSFAFKDVGAVFETKTGIRPVFSFGSTGLLAKQIAEGAPFDVFAAANVSFAEDVINAGACEADSKELYARGRVVLWTKNDAAKHAEKLEDLTDPHFVKIAIANPEHAPYGRAAEQAMKSAGIYDAIKPKLVFGENIQQTLQFAESGNVEAAVVALSLAVVSKTGRHTLIDDALHKPIDQAIVVCGKANLENARRFHAFVSSDEGRAIMRRYGFLLPGESLAAAPNKNVEWAPLSLSFQIAAIAMLIGGPLGVAIAAALASKRLPFRNLIDSIFTLPIVLPPTVLGYYVLVTLGRRSAIGEVYESIFGAPIVFTKTGAIIAAMIGALPLVVKASRAGLEGVDINLVRAARTLGAGPLRAFVTITLPLAFKGILAGLMLGFARALGDFGVTLMVAGDIPGETQTAALFIYDAIQAHREDQAMGMIVVLLGIAFVALFAANKLSESRDGS